MAYSTLALANVSVAAKRAKMALLTSGVDRYNYTFATPTSCPFGPSNFDKDPAATRQNLDIRVSGDAAEFFDGLDAWAVDYLCAHSERLFKKKLTLAQVKDMYHPCLRKAPGYDPLLRTKYFPGQPGSLPVLDGERRGEGAPGRLEGGRTHPAPAHQPSVDDGRELRLGRECVRSAGDRSQPFVPVRTNGMRRVRKD